MPHKYADCWWCGGKVRERRLTREYRWKGKLYIFEKVPMGVCNQCGEKFVRADVSKKMEFLIAKNQKPAKEISVPVYSFGR